MNRIKQISEEQVAKMVASENPWMKKPNEVPRLSNNWIPRSYLDLLYPMIFNTKLKRSVVLLGPRRVGKTILLHHVIQKLMRDGVPSSNICYFSIDHPVYTGRQLDELLDIYSKLSGVNLETDTLYAFFDEIQYMKDWERYLKSITDRFPNIKCTVSGSAAAALKLKSLESGAGRFTDFLLPPLTFYEFIHLKNEEKQFEIKYNKNGFPIITKSGQLLLNKEFLDYLNFGGYPEVIFSKEIQSDPGRFIKNDIIDKVLLRDLPSLYGISDIQELNSLFLTLAFNTANEVSLDALSQGSGLAKNTIKKYVEYLEAAFLIKTIKRVDKTAKRFKRANYFKTYLTNTSMWSALFSPVLENSENDEALRALVETAVYSQWFHSDKELHYARWKNGEVDIVELNKRKQKASMAIEVKWSDRYFSKFDGIDSVVNFCEDNKLKQCMVTTITKKGWRTVNKLGVYFIPASLYCYVLGHNIIDRKLFNFAANQTN